MRFSYVKGLVLLLSLAASPALAEPDSFHLGLGRDGEFSQASGTTFSVNLYAPVLEGLLPGEKIIPIGPLRAASAGVTRVGSTAFSAGDLVMVLQTTGIIPSVESGVDAPVDVSSDAVGRWELAQIDSATSTALTLRSPLLHSYAAGVTQVIRVPEFTTVAVSSTQVIVAEPWQWDSATQRGTGGVVAFLATGAITNNGVITASGTGLRGGLYVKQTAFITNCTGKDENSASGGRKGEGIDPTRYNISTSSSSDWGAGLGNVANGGGGGVCSRAGGGGGGNAGRGGKGGRSSDGSRDVGGMGGTQLIYSMLDHLTPGGGGGSGHGRGNGSATEQSSGGSGGGIVFIRGASLGGSGRIEASGANGLSAGDDGAGGGGAGGTIVVRLTGAMNCNSINAKGGNGGSTANARGPGGGGGGGRILYQTSNKDAGCAVNVNSGNAGATTSSGENGATPAVSDSSGSPYVGLISVLPGALPNVAAETVSLTKPASSTASNPDMDKTGMLMVMGSTAQADRQVVVYLNGVEIGRTSSTSFKAFSLELSSALPDGLYKVEAAVAFPSQGLQGPMSAAHYIQFDSVMPAPPFLTNFASGPVASGRYIQATKPGVAGTAEPGSTITVTIRKMSDNTVVLSEAAASETLVDGSWTWSWPESVTTGLVHNTGYKLTATATDKAGNVSASSYELVFTVDTSTEAPVVTQIAGRLLTPSVETRVSSTRPSVQGTAEAGSTVSLAISDSASEVVANGTVVTGSNGVWTWAWPAAADELPRTDLGSRYTVTVSATDLASNSAPMNSPVDFYVDTGTLTPTVSMIGATSVTGSGMRIRSKRPDVVGTDAEVGSTITIHIDGIVRGTSVAGADGAWDWTFSGGDLSEDLHSLVVSAQDKAGNVSPVSGTLFFYVDVTPPVLQVLRLGGLDASEGMSIFANQPNVVGKAEPGTQIILKITQAGATQVTDRLLQADNNGDWSWTWDATGSLGAGTYSLDLSATDPAGNSNTKTLAFTVDRSVSPGLVLSNVGNKPVSASDSSVAINTGRPLILGTVEQGSTVVVEFLQESASVLKITTAADSTSSVWSAAPQGTQSSLVDGPYQMTITATDRLGNSASRSLNVLVDTKAPATSIDEHPPVIGAPGNVTFTFICTDETAGSGCRTDSSDSVLFECSFEGEDFEDCGSPYNKSGLDNGEYFLLVRAVDRAGNVDGSPASFYWKVTGGAFSVEVAARPADPTKNSAAVIELLPNRSGMVTYECSLRKPGMTSSPPFEDCPATGPDAANLTRLSYNTDLQGEYVLSVKATESATAQEVIVPVRWVFDSNPPRTPVIAEPAPGVKFVNKPITRLSGSVPDAPATDRPGEGLFVKIEVAGKSAEVAVNATTRNWVYETPLSDAPAYTVSVTSRDDALNANTTPATITFAVDTVPPRITSITGRPGTLTNVPSVSMAFGASETSTFYCVLDDDPLDGNFKLCNTTGDGSYAATVSGDTSHVLYVRALDEAQNFGPYTQVIWTLDTLPPETYVKKGPSSRTNLPNAVFEFESEPGSRFECALDNGGTSFVMCEDVDFTGLLEGDHELHVRAVDAAGNPDRSPVIYPWTVDFTPPAPPEILAPSEQGVVSTVLSKITGTAEAGSAITVYLGDAQVGTTTTAGDGYWEVSLALSYPDGEYTLRATATDIATNTSPSSEGRQVRVDVTAPDTEISEGPQGRVDKTDATFVFRALGEPTPTTFRCSLDNGEFVPCSSPLSYGGLADGVHVLKVAAVDEAQNPDETPASWSWTVDLINDTRAIGGGLSCASTQTTESSFVAWFVLAGLAGLMARRRRS